MGEAVRLYLGNLPYAVDEEQLAALFTDFRSLTSVQLVRDQHTGASRGFAFAELDDEAEARAAVAALNGRTLAGRVLAVKPARPKQEFGQPGGGAE